MERSFKIIGGVALAQLTIAASAATALTVKMIGVADQMGKSAQATGQTVEQLSGLAYAAKLSDVELGSLTSALGLMARNLEKSNKATQEGKAAHSALGTLFRGNIPAFKSTDEAFLAISDRLSKLPDGFQKTALATQIFGRGAQQLIPLLNAGASGIEKLRAEAASFGVVISERTAKRAEEFNDTLTRLRTVVEGFGLKLADALLDPLTNIANMFLKNAQSAAEFEKSVQVMATSVKIAATAVLSLWTGLQDLGNLLAYLSTPVFIFTHGWDGYKAAAQSSFNELKEGGRSSAEVIRNLWSPAQLDAQSTAINSIKINENLGASYGAGSDKIAKQTAQIAERIKALRDDIALFGLSAGAAEAYRLKIAGASVAEQQLGASLAQRLKVMGLATQSMLRPLGIDKAKSPFDPSSIAAPNLALALPEIDLQNFQSGAATIQSALVAEANQINLENIPAAERYAEAIGHLNLVYATGELTIEAFNLEQKKIKQEFSEVRGFALEVREAMEQTFSRALFRAQDFGDAMKTLALRISEVAFELAVMKPLLDSLFGARGASGGGGGFGGLLSGLIGGIGSFFGGGGGGGSPFNPATFKFTNAMPGFAEGGPVSALRPIMVGERGPEMFLPATRGMIVPNHQLSTKSNAGTSGRPPIVVNLTVNGVKDADSFRKSKDQIGAQFQRHIAIAGQRSG